MEDFAVTCPLVPGVPHLRSGSCTSPRAFGLGFLQTPSHDDALALLLAFGSSYTWLEDFHPDSSVPCPAHTCQVTGAPPDGGASGLTVELERLTTTDFAMKSCKARRLLLVSIVRSSAAIQKKASDRRGDMRYPFS